MQRALAIRLPRYVDTHVCGLIRSTRALSTQATSYSGTMSEFAKCARTAILGGLELDAARGPWPSDAPGLTQAAICELQRCGVAEVADALQQSRQSSHKESPRITLLMYLRGCEDPSVKELVATAAAAKIPVRATSVHDLRRLARDQHCTSTGLSPPPIIALVRRQPKATLKDLFTPNVTDPNEHVVAHGTAAIPHTAPTPPRTIWLLVGLTKPGNMGAIVRVAEGCGASGVVIATDTVLTRGEAERHTLGRGRNPPRATQPVSGDPADADEDDHGGPPCDRGDGNVHDSRTVTHDVHGTRSSPRDAVVTRIAPPTSGPVVPNDTAAPCTTLPLSPRGSQLGQLPKFSENAPSRRVRRAISYAACRTDALLPVVYASAGDAVGAAKRGGYRVICVEDVGAVDLWDADLTGHTLVVLGGERRGIPPDVLREADVCTRIPMAGFCHSLNVASAATAVAVEVMRQSRVALFDRPAPAA